MIRETIVSERPFAGGSKEGNLIDTLFCLQMLCTFGADVKAGRVSSLAPAILQGQASRGILPRSTMYGLFPRRLFSPRRVFFGADGSPLSHCRSSG